MTAKKQVYKDKIAGNVVKFIRDIVCIKLFLVSAIMLCPNAFFGQTGSLYDIRDGQSYSTVLIGNQWWMSENLNFGTDINSSVPQSNNRIVEKYCYNDVSLNCKTYGGLYQWNEMMDYDPGNNRGICPKGWHIPSDQDWADLELTLGMSRTVVYNKNAYRGTDQGTQLKSGGSSGFNAPYSGYYAPNSFYVLGNGFCSWTSNSDYARYMYSTEARVYRWTSVSTGAGLSVRCVRDNNFLSFRRTYLDYDVSGFDGNLSFADMNNDNDLDIIYGANIYYNNNWNYTLWDRDPSDDTYSKLADLNNDNYIDRVSFFAEEGFPIDRYNVNYYTGSPNDSLNLLLFFGVVNGSSAVSDINNDGLLDLTFMIYPAMPIGGPGPVWTSIFKNDPGGSSFSEVEVNIYDNAFGSCDFGDFDNDFDNDLLITGINKINNKETSILVNEDSYFTLQDFDMVKISKGNGIWCDYDSDGDLDVVLSGENLDYVSRIYRNDGVNGFQALSLDPMGLIDCEIVSGDIDNDGDVDIVMSGENQAGSFRVNAYLNQGNDAFQVQENIVYVAEASSIDLGDFDNDSDLDLLTSRDLYQNQINRPNDPPSRPYGLWTQTKGNEVRFHWQAPSDDMTPSTGLSYNLRVGSTPGGDNIFCPPANGNEPRLKIPGRGNVSHNTGWQLGNIGSGTYYWSVQAIDAAYASSEYATEGSFTLSNTFFTDNPIYDEFGRPYYYSTNAGDFDLDGDFDLILTHSHPQSYEYFSKTYLMQNQYGESASDFRFISGRIPEMNNSSVKFCDIDRDEDLDIIMLGALNSGTLLTDIYLNNYPDSTFTVLNSGMTGLELGSIDYGDYDNDGDDDILVTGKNASGISRSIIYRNDDMTFVEYDPGLLQAAEGNGKWLDLNNDNYLDIVLSGIDNSGIGHSAVYLGTGNGFDPFTGSLKQLSGQVDFADIDNDGYLEFAISGMDSVSNVYVYVFDDIRQDFNIIPNEMVGFEYGRISFGDIDADGWHDLLVSGAMESYSTDLYSLDTDGCYAFQTAIGGHGGSIELFDLDGDNDQDIYLAGYNTGSIHGWISYYENNYSWGNSEPSVPQNMSSERNSYGIILDWDEATDVESSFGGLSYNVRIGTSSGANDIVSPMADVSGKRYINRIGNAQMNTSYKLDSLATGTYYWSVQAIDQGYLGGSWGPEQSFTISVLGADFSADTVCHGFATNFTDLSVSSGEAIISWEWDFGDGGSSSQQNPQYVYSTSGSHWVELKISSVSHSDSITHEVYVEAKPTADFASNIVCQGTSTSFINNTIHNGTTITNWWWDFDDGSTSGDQDPGTHGYLNAGNYEVELSALADNGCSDTVWNTVTVGDLPDAGITVSGNTVFCSGDSVILSNEYTATYMYQWKINGGNLGGADSSRYIARTTGGYSVEVTNPLGNCSDESAPLDVTANTAPTAPTISPGGTITFCAGDSVELSVSNHPDYTFEWLLNGGLIGADQNTFMASASGDYTLSVTNSSGCVETSLNTVTVIVNDNPATHAVIIGGATSFCDGGSVELSVTDDPTVNYQWMDDAVTLDGATINTYTATTSGNYRLLISNANGCAIETTPIPVAVTPRPNAPTIDLSDDDAFCDGGDVTLSVTNDPLLTYHWKKDGGATGADQNTHVVTASGDYTLELINTDGCEVNSSNTVTVTVYDNPVTPTVGINGDTAFCVGQFVQLSVTNNPLLSYQWMDGELNVTGANTNSYTATATGNYKLKVTSGDGCSVETKVINVIADPAPTAPTIGYAGSLEFCDTESLELYVPGNPNYTYEWQLNGGTVGTDSSSYTARASGDYTVKVKNLGDCSVMSVDTVSLIVHTSPTNPTLNLSGTTTFCEDTSLTISVANIGADNYQWLSELGEMPGEEGTSITVNETGLYKVRVTNAGSCESYSQEIAVTVYDYPGTPLILTENYVPENCMGDDPIVLSVQTIDEGVSYRWRKDGTVINGATSDSYSGYLEEGSYKVEADNNGCAVESAPQSISYAEMPDKPEIIVEGSAVWYLACSNDSATAYKWYLDGAEIEGAVDFLYVAGAELGKYEVAISVNSSCFSKSDPVWIPLGTSIEQDPWEHLKIYPNPTPGIFTLEMDNHIMGELIIDIFGETGSKIINIKFHKETAHFKTQIDLSEQPPAAYLIGLMLEKYRTNRTLIVE